MTQVTQDRVALVTGATGQDGYYLIELLLSKGYQVHGLVRWHSGDTEEVGNDLFALPGADKQLKLHRGSLEDTARMSRLVQEIAPDELYNLAALSDVHHSFQNPEQNAQVNAVGPLTLLDAIKTHGLIDKCRFYQASTSELFGGSEGEVLGLQTAHYPRSPYAIAKLYAYWMVVHYREAYNLFACNGVCFNHESPRRGQMMITRKVTEGFARMANGAIPQLAIGNPDAGRDWGHAKDYVRAMWMCLQKPQPQDHLMCTGVVHTVRELINLTAEILGFTLEWSGSGADEKAVVVAINHPEKCPAISVGQTAVVIDPKFLRPTDTRPLIGDLSQNLEGWQPEYDFSALIREMVEHYYAKAASK